MGGRGGRVGRKGGRVGGKDRENGREREREITFLRLKPVRDGHKNEDSKTLFSKHITNNKTKTKSFSYCLKFVYCKWKESKEQFHWERNTDELHLYIEEKIFILHIKFERHPTKTFYIPGNLILL